VADTLFTPTEVSADLNLLEKTLHQLGVDYELFFAGRADGKSNLLPPHRRIAEVEAIVRHYTKHPPRRTADRFRFNTLVHRYRMNCERWSRRIRQQEEEGLGRKAVPGRRSAELDLSQPQVLARTRAAAGQATGGQIRDLFLAYRTARKARGMAVLDLEYASFADGLTERLEHARNKSPDRDLELRVDEVDGKVRIAVRPLPRPENAAQPAQPARSDPDSAE
jgi:hypothetical protein